jgi:hypothetical protein
LIELLGARRSWSDRAAVRIIDDVEIDETVLQR